MAIRETLVFATGTLTLDTVPTANDTCTIGNQVYTFVASPAAQNDVDIAGTAEAQIDLFVRVINGTFATGEAEATTVRNPFVHAVKASATTMTVTAHVPGEIGNEIATTETFTAGTNVFAAAVLGSGAGNIGIALEEILDFGQLNAEVEADLLSLTPESD